MSDYDSVHILPRYSDLKSRDEVKPYWSFDRDPEPTFENPIVGAPMSTVCELGMAMALDSLGCVGVIHRYLSIEDQCEQIATAIDLSYKVGAAFSSNDKERLAALARSSATFLMGDVAHGDTESFSDAVKYLRDSGFGGGVVSANIVTVDAAHRLFRSGCDGFRVGIGSGSVCITRSVTGAGRNTLQAIRDIHDDFPHTPILACGGFKTSGDMVKALAAGASAVIVGRLLATCDESPAPRLDGKVIYAGMASYFAEEERARKSGEPLANYRQAAAEGRHELLEPTGPVSKTIAQLVGGIKAGYAYVGARTTAELHEVAEFEVV